MERRRQSRFRRRLVRLLFRFEMRVATENHIRAGPAAEMGYSYRRDDRPLEAARRIARRSVQIACGSGSRDRISRQRLVVLQRSAPARLRLRTADRLIFIWLYRLSPPCLKPRLSSRGKGTSVSKRGEPAVLIRSRPCVGPPEGDRHRPGQTNSAEAPWRKLPGSRPSA